MSPTYGSQNRTGGTTSIVWFRRDLRLGDNPAWAGAVAAGRPIVALFVLDPALVTGSGARRRNQLVAHLAELDRSLARLGGRLRVETGDPTTVVPSIAAAAGAATVFWNADTTPYAQRRDPAVEATLTTAGVDVEATWGTLVHRPGAVLTKSGSVSLVFTPFHRAWEQAPWDDWASTDDRTGVSPTVQDAPGRGVPAPDATPPEEPGEAGARRRLEHFAGRVDDYLDQRDTPAVDGTSSLSADLHFGTISPRRIATEIGTHTAGRAGFVRQLAWRDWYAHLFVDHPHLRSASLRPETGSIEWINDREEFDAWTRGRTGYPIVDAGMRELVATGRMHNRVRMLCASFLVKDLLIDWRWGERWFRDQLVDGDVTQNVGNWQWAAGTGPDAAPYFRVFNPTLQSRKFDGHGEYIKRWVPELAGLDASQIHEPSAVGPLELAANGVVIGADYPAPIVDHAWARDRALAAYDAAKADSSP